MKITKNEKHAFKVSVFYTSMNDPKMSHPDLRFSEEYG